MKKKIYVIDSSRGFTRFLKIQLSENFQFEVCNILDRIDIKKLKKANNVIVIVNELYDLFFLIEVFLKIDNVIMGTYNTVLAQQIKKIEEVVYIDLYQNKKDLINNLNFILNN